MSSKDKNKEASKKSLFRRIFGSSSSNGSRTTPDEPTQQPKRAMVPGVPSSVKECTTAADDARLADEAPVRPVKPRPTKEEIEAFIPVMKITNNVLSRPTIRKSGSNRPSQKEIDQFLPIMEETMEKLTKTSEKPGDDQKKTKKK
ncbi:unnamed protein product [Caenorhabditis sp. 36 PRJEB53466]|nr:unnamed protein product [Caenorhabditis sp. 36 PRJEB53466]